MTRDEIIDALNADDWETIERAFADLPPQGIELLLDSMFPYEDNGDLTEAISKELK